MIAVVLLLLTDALHALPQGEKLDWYSMAGIVAAAGALLWLGSLNNKVDRAIQDVDGKVGREEFTLVREKVDDIHEDVREIRRRLSNGSTGYREIE